ncbi:nuclear pore complex protein Nup88-like [Pollicipes pollicipes]|uniref:nuclear pore complex protein Nup88-like n=1 Tax=Pollicipes pollicipes TaxID=41117 RepID=UPI0018852A1B|nr:nuclear pore complex protein Nup88-like [Pollicipes pollicipes]
MKRVPTAKDWLKCSEVFSKLQKDAKSGDGDAGTTDLLDIFEHFLFFWDFKEQAVHAINLKYENSSNDGTEYQTLLLTSPPVGTVNQLLVSPCGQRLALVGASGVTVVELPSRWGRHGLYEDGKNRLSCTSRQVAGRFFHCSKHVRVTKVRWHPESPTDSHLVVLCCDNYLRVYDVATDLQTPSHVMALGATHSAMLSNSAGFTFVRSLGEVAVSFAFSPRLPPPDGQAPEEREPIAVFVLRGNGDIYLTHINLMAPGERLPMHGPVAMHPAADDNYGTEACDLLCVGGTPAVLVVATPTRLYHCVVLDRPDDGVDDGIGSDAGSSQYSACFALESAGVSLYVYESVELDLVMAPAEDDDPVTSPVRLHPDPASDCRYFCSHAAGVHAVVLPLIAALEKFAAQPDVSEEPLGEHECVVSHLVCTRTVASSPSCPVLGLAVIPHPLLMVVLLATHEVLLLSLTTRFKPPLPEAAAPDEDAVRPPQDAGEPFDAHVRRLLERDASENHHQLVRRTEAVYQSCQRDVPVLSDAERDAARQLKELGSPADLRRRLDIVRDKIDYQRRQASVERANKQRQDRQLAALAAAPRERIRAELVAQGDQIAALVRSVQDARKTLGL